MKSPCLDTAFVERVRHDHGASPVVPSFTSPHAVSPPSANLRSPPQSLSPRQTHSSPYSPSSASPAAAVASAQLLSTMDLSAATARLSLSPLFGLQAEKSTSSPFENSKAKGSPFADVEANRALRAASLDEFDASPSPNSKKGAISPASRLSPRSPFTPTSHRYRSPLTAESLSPDIFAAKKYSPSNSQSSPVASITGTSSQPVSPNAALLPLSSSSPILGDEHTTLSPSSPLVASKYDFDAAPLAAAYSLSPSSSSSPSLPSGVIPSSTHDNDILQLGHMSHTPLPPSPLDEPSLYHPQRTVRGYYEDTSRLGVYYEAAGNMTNFYAYSADALKAKTDAFVQKQRQEAAMVSGGYGCSSSSLTSPTLSPLRSGSNAHNLSYPTDTSSTTTCGARVLQVSLREIALSGPQVKQVNALLDSGSWVATLRVGPTGEKTEPMHRGLPTSSAWEDGHSSTSTMSVPLVPSGDYRLVPVSSSSSTCAACLVAHVANPWQHACLELHAAYRPSAATRLGLADASPLLSLELPTQDLRFMSAHLHHPPQQEIGSDHDDNNNNNNGLVSSDGSVAIPDASSWSEFTGTLSFPGVSALNGSGTGAASVIKCKATVSVRCSWATRAHTGAYGEVPALMPLFPSGRMLVLTILNPQDIPLALLREAEAAAATSTFGRSTPLRAGKRRVTLGLENNSMRIGDSRLVSSKKLNDLSSAIRPLTAYAPLINESGGCVYSPLQLSVYVASPNDAVLLVTYDESDELVTSSAVLASALVPYWDERFSGGLKTALYLESTFETSKFHKSQKQQEDHGDVAVHVKAYLQQP